MNRRQWMRSLRDAYGMTQKAFAEKLGVDLRTYGRWERGEYWPRGVYYRTLMDAARAVKYPPPPPREE